MINPLKRPKKSGKGSFCTAGMDSGIQTEYIQLANV